MWRYPWIKNDDSFYTQSQCPEGLEDLRVSDILEVNARVWNEELLSQLFSPNDTKRIKCTAVAPRGIQDKLT